MKVAVIGLGLMGAGIAEVCARAGCDVLAIEYDQRGLDAGTARLSASLGRAVDRGRLDPVGAQLALSRITTSLDYADLSDRDLVIEAATENEQAKLAIFTRLDEAAGPRTILASNTSSIPITKLALATTRPELVVGMHFFNPVPARSLVEVIPSLMTSDETRAAVEAFARDRLRKDVVFASDRAGFIVNALLIPYLLSAVRMFEGGHASRDDIDKGMVEGCAHPMGPLALIDLVGLDTVAAIARIMFAEYGEPHLLPPPLLSRMVEAGLTGRKAGKGFYEYAS